jgi:hypothetical protein
MRWRGGDIPLIPTVVAPATVSIADIAKVAGLVCGVALAVFVGWVFWRVCSRIPRKELRLVAIVLGWILTGKLLALIFCPGFFGDIYTFQNWAKVMAQNGPGGPYGNPPGFFIGATYPPGGLYLFWLSGCIAKWLGWNDSRVIFAAWPLVADYGIGILLYVITRPLGKAVAWLSALVFTLNPAFLYDTLIWQQIDSEHSFLMLLAVATIPGPLEITWGVTALALGTKPFALTLLPMLLTVTLIRGKWPDYVLSIGAMAIVTFLVCASFFMEHSIGWFPASLKLSLLDMYHDASLNAFNMPALLAGAMRTSETGTVWGITYSAIGYMCLWALGSIIVCGLWIKRTLAAEEDIYYTAFLATYGFFLFATRMHERYFYAGLLFLIPVVAYNWILAPTFVLMSATGLLSVMNVYANTGALDMHNTPAGLGSMVNVICFCIILGYWIGGWPKCLAANGNLEDKKRRAADGCT